MKKLIIIAILLAVTTFVNAQKYVFLFIGDGMGQSDVDLYEAYLAEKDGKEGFVQSNISKIPLLSMCTTHCKNRRITDSGAAGSAIACGQKFNVGEIAYSETGNQPKSIAKVAKEKGMKVGIISTAPMNHATPASFYANQPTRKNYYQIGLQLAESNFDFFGGGGLLKQTGNKKDEKDLMTIYQESGYLTFTSLKAIASMKSHNNKVIFTNETLDRDASIPYKIDREDAPNNSLAEIVETAIIHLDNPKGFFMMVEGGKIDYAAHDNDAGSIIGEMEDFDNAIAEAYKFYLQHKNETMIIITADHETGGVSLGIADNGYESDFGILSKQKMSMSKFGTIIKKQTKNEDNVSLKEYTDLASKYFMGIEMDFSADEQAILNEAYAAINAKSNRAKDEAKSKYNGNNPMAYAFCQIMNRRASVGFTTNAHTCAKVPVYAVGTTTPILDNTEIFGVIKSFIEK
ncbi:MAG: alkaline phosphatase [Bacteroidales bacterium]|nr:alkaline phosphatase [Bacteroidales bacterium]MBQ1731106.1 alkaline phosphatase [Bacteroidales bacterium]MBQ4009600.1 alkaline phosphatase [Bacteroidales bacterium]MBQ6275247.1 alkaline phosphatase [Bacteroidales bacterium]MBR3799457.1 alkaline phosphatase [Bacteroidales bacterium]